MLTGTCGCGKVTYKVAESPLTVHCCHCTECQKQTGTAYALNAIVETHHVSVAGETTESHLPTPSGKGQVITRCAACGTAIFSAYMVRKGKLTYVRVGTLDDPSACPPEVQIFTNSKLPWVPLYPDIPTFAELYVFKDVWPEDRVARLNALFDGNI